LVYEITYKKSTQKDIKRLPKEKLRKIRETIEKKLTTNPYACEKLTGEFEGQYKLVVWPYRIIFTISGKQIIILRIRHRKESYQ
jgi:addiction module RelE/StbE family toxin